MAATHKRPSLRAMGASITKSDWKLLLCVVIFAASVGLKYAHSDVAQRLRIQAAALLHGGTETGTVMEVLGKAVNRGDILSVFGAQTDEKEAFSPFVTEPAAAITANAESTSETDAVPLCAEGGYSEDLEDRAETLFPKEADETAYVMSFSHVQPVTATLSSTFGARTHPISGKRSYHFGLDLAAPKGTAILSLADGTVRETGSGSYGNYLIVDHADGFATLYAHCDKLIAKTKDIVKAGQTIAEVGATGNATGNHLHFEIWRGGKALNPLNYVQYECAK